MRLPTDEKTQITRAMTQAIIRPQKAEDGSAVVTLFSSSCSSPEADLAVGALSSSPDEVGRSALLSSRCVSIAISSADAPLRERFPALQRRYTLITMGRSEWRRGPSDPNCSCSVGRGYDGLWTVGAYRANFDNIIA